MKLIKKLLSFSLLLLFLLTFSCKKDFNSNIEESSFNEEILEKELIDIPIFDLSIKKSEAELKREEELIFSGIRNRKKNNSQTANPRIPCNCASCSLSLNRVNPSSSGPGTYTVRGNYQFYNDTNIDFQLYKNGALELSGTSPVFYHQCGNSPWDLISNCPIGTFTPTIVTFNNIGSGNYEFRAIPWCGNNWVSFNFTITGNVNY